MSSIQWSSDGVLGRGYPSIFGGLEYLLVLFETGNECKMEYISDPVFRHLLDVSFAGCPRAGPNTLERTNGARPGTVS